MHITARLSTLLVAVASTFGAQAQSRQEETAAIKAHFTKYTALMNSVDTDPISTEIYSTPAFFALPGGRQAVVMTPEELSKSWRSQLAEREKHPGLPLATFDMKSVCFLRADVAAASLHFEAPQSDGTTKKSDWLYLLQKSNGGWRITYACCKEPRSILGLQWPVIGARSTPSLQPTFRGWLRQPTPAAELKR